jgi:hypothetical protein
MAELKMVRMSVGKRLPKKETGAQRMVSKILSLLVFVAILPLPYDYYQILRVIVSLGSVYLLVSQYNSLGSTAKGGLIVTALVYNPFIPVHLSKMLWVIINIVSGIFLLTLSDHKKSET